MSLGGKVRSAIKCMSNSKTGKAFRPSSRPGWMGPGQPGLVLNVDVGSPACGRQVGAS